MHDDERLPPRSSNVKPKRQKPKFTAPEKKGLPDYALLKENGWFRVRIFEVELAPGIWPRPAIFLKAEIIEDGPQKGKHAIHRYNWSGEWECEFSAHSFYYKDFLKILGGEEVETNDLNPEKFVGKELWAWLEMKMAKTTHGDLYCYITRWKLSENDPGWACGE
jgi:hypothetical protein